jgi:hypothetical protein
MLIYELLEAEALNSGLLLDLYNTAFPFMISIVVLTIFGKMIDEFFVKDVRMWNYLVIGTSMIIFLIVLRRALDFIVSPAESLTPLVFTALVGIIICSFFVKISQIGRRENWLEA